MQQKTASRRDLPYLNFSKGNYSELSAKDGKEQCPLYTNEQGINVIVDNRHQVELQQQNKSYSRTVGMIQSMKDGKQFVGSGALISYKGRCMLLTCAHNFYQKVSKHNGNKMEEVENSTFKFQQKEFEKFEKQSRIIDFLTEPSYSIEDIHFGNDIALGVLDNETELYQLGQGTESNWSFIESMNPKVGETIVVIGYPGQEDKQGKCYQEEGQITQIFDGRDDNEERCLIGYSQISTTPGQSGSPVFLKRGDQYTLIGVHVGDGFDPDGNKCNMATGITLGIYKWILQQFETQK